MKALALVLLFAAGAASAQDAGRTVDARMTRPKPAGEPGEPFDDSDVRISYAPADLWRDRDGRFTATRVGDSILLRYAFFDETNGSARYASCPPDRGEPGRAPDCAAVQEAVGDALKMWADASDGKLRVTRAAPGQTPDIWIAWTNGFTRMPPIARVVDDTRDAASEPPDGVAPDYGGFAHPAFPGARKAYSALLFNDSYCWKIADGACPAPTVLPNGKTVSRTRDARLVALHESGHALGFGHFTRDTIMGMAGGSERYELAPYDREAVRRLYSLVLASLAR